MTLLLACGAYTFMYRDTVTKAQEEALVKSEVLAASEQVTEAKNMEIMYQSTTDDRGLLPSFFVSSDDAVPFIDAVEAIGPATGSTLSLSSLSDSADGGSSHSIVTAAITVSGTWPNVMRAIGMVENLPYAISIKDLYMSESQGSPAKPGSTIKPAPRWTASLDISVLSSS